MKQHFVEFMSPGTFVDEVTRKPIDAWNVEEAVRMAAEVNERHGARPYGFCFTTRGREEDDLDSREIDRSHIYYLGGRILTLEDVRRLYPDSILLSNMQINDIACIIENANSWKVTKEWRENDVILEQPAWAGVAAT